MKNNGKRGIRRAFSERLKAKQRKKVEEHLRKEIVWHYNCGSSLRAFRKYLSRTFWEHHCYRNEGKPRPNWTHDCWYCDWNYKGCDCPGGPRDFRLKEQAAFDYKDWRDGVDFGDPFLNCEDEAAMSLSEDFDGDEMRYIYVMGELDAEGLISYTHTTVEAADEAAAYCEGFDVLVAEGRIPERSEFPRNDYVIPLD